MTSRLGAQEGQRKERKIDKRGRARCFTSLFLADAVIQIPSIDPALFDGRLKHQTLLGQIGPDPDNNLLQIKVFSQFQEVPVSESSGVGDLSWMTEENGSGGRPCRFKQAGGCVESKSGSDKVMKRRVVRPCKVMLFQFSGWLKPDPCDRNRCPFQPQDPQLEPPDGLVQG